MLVDLLYSIGGEFQLDDSKSPSSFEAKVNSRYLLLENLGVVESGCLATLF